MSCLKAELQPMAVPGRAQTFSTVPTLPKRVAKFCHCLQSSLARELANAIEGRRSFPAVLTKEADIKPDSKVVRLENTIIQYTRGSSTARYMVGFGAGMPRVRVRGKMTEWGGAKPLCLFEIEKAGDWFGSGFTSSKTLQTHAGIELAEDVAAFIAKATKHEKINYH